MRWIMSIAVVAGCGFHSGAATPDAAPVPDAPPDSPPPMGDYLAVAANNQHTCAIKQDHTLWCWGDNQFGQIGVDGAESDVATPTQVGTAQWTQVAAGTYHVCGIQTDGTAWCWGRNAQGQLGVDETTGFVGSSAHPLPVASALHFTEIAAGYEHTCAIATDQTVYCFGENSYGQFGIGTTAGSRVPLQISSSTVLAIAAGVYQTCGIMTDHTLWCSGYNYYGELGDGSSGSTTGGGYHLTGVQVAGSWQQVVAAGIHTCGITTDGHLRCWGWNGHGQLGDGTATDRWQPQVVGVDHADWVNVAVGAEHTCGVRADGSLWCWGADERGELAISEGTQIDANPTLIPAVTGATSIGLGAAHTCAVGGDHFLSCTGVGALGELGDGTQSRRTPVQIPGTWDRASAGGAITCARRGDGTLACWGDNTYAQLGDGRAVPSASPATAAVPAATAIAAGAVHACEITGTGDVWCWGFPSYAETGDVNAVRSLPGKVANATASAISARDHTCTIPTVGTGLWCWGNNYYAQLGTGSTAQNYMANNVITAQTFVTVAAGGEHRPGGRGHTCAIDNVGTLECWGDNEFGQIGNGFANATLVTAPAVQTGTWSAVSLGARHSCALASSGLLSCWGANGNGQLGTGGTTAATVPTAVDAAVWTKLSLGENHSCGIKADSSLWCWGANLRGQVGDGTTADKYIPTRVGTANNWVDVEAGSAHTCALASDQSLWCWGENDSGQVGDGTGWRAQWQHVP